MPDLDYHTPAVREEARKIATFWLTAMGVDGFRLDAVPYLVEEGSAQIGTAGTHRFLREYAAAIKRVAPDVFTVGEVWDGLDRMLPYYPDQLESYFAFDLSDALIDAATRGSAKSVLERVERFEKEVPQHRYSTFLRNHDQTRTMTALGGDVAKAKLVATLLLTLPGLPFVYYGEEIGMTGDKPDERLRTPMQWSAASGAGFTRGTPWEALQSDWPTTHVAAQDADSSSLLALYRDLIHLRSEKSTLGSGDFAPLGTSNDAVVAYLRRDGARVVMVVANLGGSEAHGGAISSSTAVLPAGRYATNRLLRDGVVNAITVDADGRITRYVPSAAIAPLETYVIELSRMP